jgi:hypothetical protein
MRAPKEGTRFSQNLKETLRNDDKRTVDLRNRGEKQRCCGLMERDVLLREVCLNLNLSEVCEPEINFFQVCTPNFPLTCAKEREKIDFRSVGFYMDLLCDVVLSSRGTGRYCQ